MNDVDAVLRLTAFASDPSGGNPAGVVLDARGMTDQRMQEIAAHIGYAETAFVLRRGPAMSPRRIAIRYFSPTAEVPFCGHATVATAVALADRGEGKAFLFETPAGEVAITTRQTPTGTIASFTSVQPLITTMPGPVLFELLGILGLGSFDLHPGYPPRLAFAGNTHPVLVLSDVARFDSFRFDPVALRILMDAQSWTGTVTVLCVRSGTEFDARNLFPVGTMTEDPATGSAAAAVGGYLRELRLLQPPRRILIHQGRHVGRPSLLTVDVPATGGIVVSGSALAMQ